MSDPWAAYLDRIRAKGGTRRGTALRREQTLLADKAIHSLSFHTLTIDGEERNMTVINTDNLDTKRLVSQPGEDIPHGGIVEWMDNHWLITEKDANNEVYTRAVMRQCNYLLRWVSADREVVERWCIVEDGTKYLTGEFGDRNFVLNRGDARAYLYLPRDDETVRLNRQNRFLVDDYGSPNVLAYRLTKPFKLGGSYNQNGILSFVMAECNTEETDDLENHIANYYQYFPRETDGDDFSDVSEETGGDETEAWL